MSDLAEQLEGMMPTALRGSVAQTVGMTIAAAGFPAPVGAVAEIQRRPARRLGRSDRLPRRLTLLYPLSDLAGVRHGNRVRLVRTAALAARGHELLGRVIDAEGRAVDGRPQPALGRPHGAATGPAPPLHAGRESTSRWRPASARSTAC